MNAVRLSQIRNRLFGLSPAPWTVEMHAHPAAGCRCMTCYDPPTGWSVDHEHGRYCDDVVGARNARGELNEFGKPLVGCDSLIPLLSFEDVDFAAHAREDVPWLLNLVDDLMRRLAEGSQT